MIFDLHCHTRFGSACSYMTPEEMVQQAVKVGLDPTGQQIESAVLAMGPVAPTPFRALEAEAFLCGKPARLEVLKEAARLVQQAGNPRDSVARASRAYRLALIPTLLINTLQTAVQRAQMAAGIELFVYDQGERDDTSK